jgi:hypothetical protein
MCNKKIYIKFILPEKSDATRRTSHLDYVPVEQRRTQTHYSFQLLIKLLLLLFIIIINYLPRSKRIYLYHM